MHSNERKVPVHVSQRGIEERKNFNKRTNSRIYLECQINQVKHCKNTYFGVYLNILISLIFLVPNMSIKLRFYLYSCIPTKTNTCTGRHFEIHYLEFKF